MTVQIEFPSHLLGSLHAWARGKGLIRNEKKPTQRELSTILQFAYTATSSDRRWTALVAMEAGSPRHQPLVMLHPYITQDEIKATILVLERNLDQ